MGTTQFVANCYPPTLSPEQFVCEALLIPHTGLVVLSHNVIAILSSLALVRHLSILGWVWGGLDEPVSPSNYGWGILAEFFLAASGAIFIAYLVE